MVRVSAVIEGKELVYTDTFITGLDEVVTLKPFDDDNEYQIKFTIRVDLDDQTSNNIFEDAEGVLYIEHFRSKNLVLPTATRVEPSFAHDEKFDYFVSFSVMPCRAPVGVIYQVVYNVLRKPA